jgi:hypothetical protein
MDTALKTGELHFKADILSSTSSSQFYIYFDNPNAQSYTATSTFGRNAVWTGYRAVYHGDGTTDSTGNGFTLTNQNNVPFNTAKLGNGFDGGPDNKDKSLFYTGDIVTADEVAAGGVKPGIQVEMWAYPYNTDKFNWIWGLRAGPDPLRTIRTA